MTVPFISLELSVRIVKGLHCSVSLKSFVREGRSLPGGEASDSRVENVDFVLVTEEQTKL